MEPYERLGVALKLRQLSQGQLAHKAPVDSVVVMDNHIISNVLEMIKRPIGGH